MQIRLRDGFRWAVLLAALLVSAPSVQADTAGGHPANGAASTGKPEEPDDGKPCEEDCDCGSGEDEEGEGAESQSPSDPKSGDPVDIQSGRNFARFVDLVVPGVYPIRVVRYYDSQSTYDSPLGHGWALNLHMGAYKDESGHYTVRSRCGNRSRYLFNGASNPYTPASPAEGRVPVFRAYSIPDHSSLPGSPVPTAIRNGHERVQPGGERVVFDALGRVFAFYDANGNKQQFVYADEGVAGPGAGGVGEDDRFPLIGTTPYASRPEKLITTGQYYKLLRVHELVRDQGQAISSASAYLDTGRYVELEYDDGGAGEGNTGRLIEIRAKASASDPRVVRYYHDEPAAPASPTPLCVSADPYIEMGSTNYRGATVRYAGNLTRVELPSVRYDGGNPSPIPETLTETYEYRDALTTPWGSSVALNDPNHPDDPSTDFLCRLRDYHNLTRYKPSSGEDAWFYEYDKEDRVTKEIQGASKTDWTRAEWTFTYPVAGAPTPLWILSRRIATPNRDNPTDSASAAVTTSDEVYTFTTAGEVSSREVWSGARNTSPLIRRIAYIRLANSALLQKIITCGPATIGGTAGQGCTSNGNVAYQTARTVELTYDSAGNLRTRKVALGFGGEEILESWSADTGDPNWVGAYEIKQGTSLGQGGESVSSVFSSARPAEINPDVGRGMRLASTTVEIGGSEADETTSYRYDEIGGQLEATVTPESSPGANDRVALCRLYNPASSGAFQSRGRPSESGLELGVSALPSGCGTLDGHLRRTFTYDTMGFVASVTDARSNPTSFQFDPLGRVTQITNALGEITRFRYSGPNQGNANPATWPAGRFLTEIERGATSSTGGVKRRFVYNGRGRLVEIQNEDSLGTFSTLATFVYDSDGNRILSTDAGRDSTDNTSSDETPMRVKFYFDAANRLTKTVDEAPSTPNETLFEYDAFDNRTKVTNVVAAGNRVVTYVYDGFDRLRSVTEPGPSSTTLVTEFGYDAKGNVKSVTEPGAASLRTTQYDYDGASRLKEVRQPNFNLGASPPRNHRMQYRYDDRGRLFRLTNARGHVLEYRYESWGGLSEVHHFENETDANNSSPPAHRIVRYSYDLSGNLRSTSDSVATTAFGSLPTAGTDLLANRLYTFSYDALDRVDAVIAHYIDGPTGVTIDSTFDPRGNRSSFALTDPSSSGAVQTWCHDRRDRLESLFSLGTSANCASPGSANVQLAHYPNDDLQKVIHGNGLITRYAFQSHGPLDRIEVTEATPGDVLELDYTVDALLQIDAIEESIGGGSPESYDYGYDPTLRLTSASYPASTALPTENFVYDARGNRQAATGNLFAYDADNRITESSGGNPKRCFGHDADGNLVTIGNEGSSGCSDSVPIRTLVWDKLNRLTSVSETGVLGSYVYDPFGRRIAKTASSTTTKFLWDGDQLLAEYQGTTRTRRYEYAGGFSPARVQMGSAGVMEVHTDHLDTPRMLTDSTKATFWQASYEAYGKAQIDVDPGASLAFNIRFPGQYFDAETGMHYNRYRYYEPGTGRYVSADPIGQAGGINQFTYVLNHPVSLVDFLGWRSFLLSRPLAGGAYWTGANHAFIATNADCPGDPEATLHSFGESSAPDSVGQVGRVNGSTKGLSETTSTDDWSFWLSLANETSECCKKSGPGFQEIDAPDAVVDDYASRLTAPQVPYALAPGYAFSPNANSNSAAQAIADAAQGTRVPMPDGYRYSPGKMQTGNVRFH